MIEPLTTFIVSGSLVLALIVTGHLVLGRRPGTWLLALLALLEVALLAQFVIGVVLLIASDGDVAVFTFMGYLLAVLLVPLLGTFWALGEQSRSGTAVLLLAVLLIPFLELRIEQIWSPGV